MNSCIVSYQCACVGINFTSFRIEINAAPILSFSIKADGSMMEIDVEMIDVLDEHAAKHLAFVAVCKLLDHICLMFLVKIGEPHEMYISFPQNNESDVRLAVHNMYQNESLEHVQLQFFPDLSNLEALKIQVESFWNHNCMHMKLFRNSISQEDPITRYLLLYNLLLFMNSDNQRTLDECLRAIDPEVEQTSTPNNRNSNNNRSETIYTRLRNEIAHIRPGVVPRETLREITQHLSKFTDIVKQAVLNQITRHQGET